MGCAGSAEGGAAHRIGVPDRRGTAYLGDAGFVEVNMIKRGCAADFRGLAAWLFSILLSRWSSSGHVNMSVRLVTRANFG